LAFAAQAPGGRASATFIRGKAMSAKGRVPLAIVQIFIRRQAIRAPP
jgi:hypothetical protein